MHYCSIPRWLPFAAWYERRFWRLCKIHDRNYSEKTLTRFQCDCLFAGGIFARGYPLTSLFSYIGVRLYGWVRYRK